jgi:hypothetical protein
MELREENGYSFARIFLIWYNRSRIIVPALRLAALAHGIRLRFPLRAKIRYANFYGTIRPIVQKIGAKRLSIIPPIPGNNFSNQSTFIPPGVLFFRISACGNTAEAHTWDND